jgi:Holliday junction resolvasome RuvABC endonuclease subunit
VSESALILGIDPSSGVRTDSSITGLALLRVGLSCRPVLVGHAACSPTVNHKDSLTNRILRITETAGDVEEWGAQFGDVDAVGYERPYMDPTRKNATYDALVMACGAILCSVQLNVRGKAYAIHPSTAKGVYGGSRLGRDAAKAAAIAWAKREYNLPDMDPVSLEAIADALAVAVATVAKWREDQHLQSNLFTRKKAGVK